MSIICHTRSQRSNHYTEDNNYAHTHTYIHTLIEQLLLQSHRHWAWRYCSTAIDNFFRLSGSECASLFNWLHSSLRQRERRLAVAAVAAAVG